MRKGQLVGWILPLTLLFGVGVLGALRADRPGGDIPWSQDLDTALRRARQAHQPLLLSFHTYNCDWCAKLDAETFTDPKVVALSRRYVCVRLDSDVDGALCTRYHILQYPTTLMLDPQGREVARLTGYIPPEHFAPAMEAVLSTLDRNR
jgi:uncharacterized protein YyaL (SSP411 family)